ncbi:Endonuclease V [Gimesia chilikensis]|nr:Endonuclease V [Gimesia chilikensis]
MFPVNLALDVYYHPDDSVAGLLFDDWESDQVAETLLKSIPEVAEYEPGQFYKRELPCLLALIADVKPELETIVIDGYVTLGADQRPGLGTCLYQELGEEIPIIGVAKSRFNQTPAETEILRGNSQNPLFVTALGIPLTDAQQKIKSMHGPFRIPTLLKQVDQLCRVEN